MKKVLFVCMGNICRSPAAEGVFQHLISENKLNHKLYCDSAGTISFHAGKSADKRMISAARKRGYELNSKARQIQSEDFNLFDIIVTMDDENYSNVMKLTKSDSDRNKVKKFCDFCKIHTDKEVPDPYYGGTQGFEHVLDLLEDGCSELLKAC